ncbi:hypothetical protein pb186bvf_003893 [Paramecium bursaria]
MFENEDYRYGEFQEYQVLKQQIENGSQEAIRKYFVFSMRDQIMESRPIIIQQHCDGYFIQAKNLEDQDAYFLMFESWIYRCHPVQKITRVSKYFQNISASLNICIEEEIQRINLQDGQQYSEND